MQLQHIPLLQGIDPGRVPETSDWKREGAQGRLLPSPERDELWVLGQGDLGVPQCVEPTCHCENSTGKCSGICRQSTHAQRVDGS
ncbi:hypothetical protein DV515_00012807, partial [Chloebia gouldiae]